jgi:hypothetical protein
MAAITVTMIGIVIVWVLLPTVPALIMFKFLPGNTFNLSGPLGNFKINASGAIGAYFAVLIAIPFYTDTLKKQFVPPAPRQFWTVTGDIDLVDVKGEIIPIYLHESELKVKTDPEMYSINSNNAKLTINLVKGESGFPSIRIYSDKFLPQFVSIEERSPLFEFRENNEIHIKQRLQIRQDPASVKKVETQTETRGINVSAEPAAAPN